MMLEEVLADALEERVERLPDLRTLTIGQRRAILPLRERQELAGEIARADGIQRKSAMRQLQRYITEGGEIRRPKPATAERLARRLAALPFRRSGIVVMSLGNVAIQVSKDCRIRTIDVVVRIPPDDAGPILDAWLEGDYERMARLFAKAYGDAYGIRDLEIGCDELPEDEEIDEVDIRPGEEE